MEACHGLSAPAWYEASYHAFGYELVDIPAGDVADRVDAVDAVISWCVDDAQQVSG